MTQGAAVQIARLVPFFRGMFNAKQQHRRSGRIAIQAKRDSRLLTADERAYLHKPNVMPKWRRQVAP